MKITKRLIRRLFIFTFAIICLLSGFSIKTKAGLASDYDLYITGASIRKTGERQGIRFRIDATKFLSDDYELLGVGAYIAFGYCTEEALWNAIENNTKINDHTLLHGYNTIFEEQEGIYYITLFNIPADQYSQAVTAIPYANVILSGETNPTKLFGNQNDASLAQVSLYALNDGVTGGLIDEVKNKVEDYKKMYMDNLGYIHVDDYLYESDPNRLRDLFVKNYNKYFNYAYADEGHLNYTDSATVFASKIKTSDTTLNTDSNLYVFLKNSTKWNWLINLLQDSDVQEKGLLNTAVYTQITILTTTDTTSTAWNGGEDLANAIAGIFYADATSAYSSSAFNNYAYVLFGNIIKYNSTVYADLSYIDALKDGEYFKFDTIATVNSDDSVRLVNLEDNAVYYPDTYTPVPTKNLLLSYSTKSIINSTPGFPNRNFDTSYTDSWNINYNVSSHNFHDASVTFTSTQDIIFNGTTIQNERVLLGTSSADFVGPNVKSLTFNNCTFTFTTDKPITLAENDNQYSCDIVFNNCTFNCTNNAISSWFNITNNCNISFINCIFTGSTGNVINILKSTNGVGEIGNVLLDNCTFTNFGGAALYVEYYNPIDASQYITIKDCSFENGECALEVGTSTRSNYSKFEGTNVLLGDTVLTKDND